MAFDPTRRYGFLVTGPNASGKTTALQAAMEPYVGDPRVRAVYADNSDRRTFKGDKVGMTDLLCQLWQGPEQILIVEGTRMPTIMKYAVARLPEERELRAFVTISPPATMEALLRRRCQVLGKRYREDYWTVQKFTYEGTRRYRRSVPVFVPEAAISWWTMDLGYGAALEMSAAIRAALRAILGEPRPVLEAIAQPAPAPPAPDPAQPRLF